MTRTEDSPQGQGRESAGTPHDRPGNGFVFNQPSAVVLLYLGGFLFAGVPTVCGVVMAYLWRREPGSPWALTHHIYMIRTFWLAVLALVLGLGLSVVWIGPVSVGVVILAFGGLQMIARCIASLNRAQKSVAMPAPRTLLF